MKITSFSIIAFFGLSLSLSSFAARQSAIDKFGRVYIKTTSTADYDAFAKEEFEKKKKNINILATISNFEADGIDELKRKIKEHTDLILQIIKDTGVSKNIRSEITEQYEALEKEINQKLENFSEEKANISLRTARENIKAIIYWFMSDESRLENPKELFLGALGATLKSHLVDSLGRGLMTLHSMDNNKNSVLLKELFSLLKPTPTKESDFKELTAFLKKLLDSDIGYTHLKSVFIDAQDLLDDINEERTKPMPPPRKPKSPQTSTSETQDAGGGASATRE